MEILDPQTHRTPSTQAPSTDSTKTVTYKPRCHAPGLEITDHIYCPACKRRFRLPVLPREITVERKVAELSFDYGDGTEDVADITVQDKYSVFGDKYR